MGRYKLTIEYDGTRYSGWQMQKGGKTIQGEILDACRELFRNDEISEAQKTDSACNLS
jgi:tRNA pseudouridine38-40 synthase